jgi:uncharacterized membrane protein YfcA
LTAGAGSALTFYSGFGLGTLLLPVFAIFFPVELAVGMTAVVHLLNNLFKFSLVGRYVNGGVFLRFGFPAIGAAFLGASLLVQVSDLPAIMDYTVLGYEFSVEPVKLVIGLLIIVFAGFEIIPSLSRWTVSPRYLPFGGMLSGFFGGLSGHQGALRSAFLVRCGLSKESFIATGVAIAVCIDVSRLMIYGSNLSSHFTGSNGVVLGAATASAFVGALLGNLYLKKITMTRIQQIVASMLLVFALLMAGGII